MKAPVRIVTSILIFVLTLTLGAETLCVQDIGSKSSAESTNSTEFRYGINYLSAHSHYNPDYTTDAVLNRDFATFKKQGLKYLTLLVIWNYFEPDLEIYNIDALDNIRRVCEVAATYSLQVIIDFHTQMFDNSPKIPDWVIPRRFQTVFTNDSVHQAWLNFLNHTVSYLNDVENIYSWHMMNEPAFGSWTGDANVTVNDFIQLWTEMRGVFKSWSDRPVSIRFSAYEFGTYFRDNESDICNLCDYIALNWYEDGYYAKEQLVELISEIRQYKPVMISEFGYNATTDEENQAGNFTEYINLFKNAGVHDIIAWMWRADKSTPEIPSEEAGVGNNLAKDWDGTPKKAFFLLRDDVPPLVSIESPENGAYYATNELCLNLTVGEQTSWIGYCLDGQPNATIVGNTTLIDLSNDYHSLVVFANDTAGNMGTSNTTSFVVDTIPPNMTQITQTPNADAVLPDNAVRIDAAIYDANGVKSATLFYTTDKETWITVEMTLERKETWNATISAFPYGTNVTYRMEAQDVANNNITSEECGYHTLTYTVIPEFPTALILPMLIIATSAYALFIKKKKRSLSSGVARYM